MGTVLRLVSLLLYVSVGTISLSMAYKNLSAQRFLPFHEKAAGRSWDDLDVGIRSIVIALMNVAGLGFLVVAFLLIAAPIVDWFSPSGFLRYGIPSISLVYCAGLGISNYRLHARTRAETPWKRSFSAAFLLFIGIVMSLVRQ